VLKDPMAPSRLFATNATTEYQFLTFQQEVRSFIFEHGEWYNSMVSFSVVTFVIRVLRSFQFQIHLGVITRTVEKAAPDLLHFLFLLLAVFLGYAVAGNLIFGHEVEFMSTVGKALVQNFWIVITLDPTMFYDKVCDWRA
jgi:hypothetical protein